MRQRLRLRSSAATALRLIGLMGLVGLIALLPGAPALAEECAAPARIEHRFDSGASWSFCWRLREQNGLVIESAAWTPPDAAPIPVLASGSLAQLHVAYDDSDVTYSDVTQYGLGGGWLQTLSQADCPGRRISVDQREVLCLHVDAAQGSDAAVVLFSVSQVGAYVYIVTWRFGSDGSLTPSVGASGALQRRGHDVALPFGRVLGGDPDTLWLSHTHSYYWRLDLDLGSSASDDRMTRSDYATQPDGTRTRTTRALAREFGARLARDGLQVWHLRARAPRAGEPLSAVPGYRLGTADAGHAFARTDVESWSGEDLFVTVQRDCERFASQNARFEPGCADHVQAFADGESLDGQDLVIWQRIAFHHVPRNEDRQYMHTHWDGFRLSPENLVGDTPRGDVPTTFGPDARAPDAGAPDARNSDTGADSAAAAKSGGGAAWPLAGIALLLRVHARRRLAVQLPDTVGLSEPVRRGRGGKAGSRRCAGALRADPTLYGIKLLDR